MLLVHLQTREVLDGESGLVFRCIQSLKYKFGGPGTLKKFGALLQTEGAPLNLLVPLTKAVWGLGTLAGNYKGPRNGVPPYFNLYRCSETSLRRSTGPAIRRWTRTRRPRTSSLCRRAALDSTAPPLSRRRVATAAAGRASSDLPSGRPEMDRVSCLRQDVAFPMLQLRGTFCHLQNTFSRRPLLVAHTEFVTGFHSAVHVFVSSFICLAAV